MKTIKNIAALLLVLCMALSLYACGGNNAEATEAPTEAPATEAPTEAVPETEAADSGLTNYSVTVVDEEGNGIAGAMVQICLDTCFPGMTNESGVAEFNVQEADYKVSFLAMPAGFTYSTEEQEFYFEHGSTELTITLKAAE